MSQAGVYRPSNFAIILITESQHNFDNGSFRFNPKLKAPVMTAADDRHEYFFIFFPQKTILSISCESSARQRSHMKYQALFPLKDKSKQEDH